MYQNYPNPFNATTRIGFELGEKMHVKLRICDLIGRQVRILLDGVQDVGRHEIIWDGRTDAGVAAASGLYLYTVEGRMGWETKKLALVR
jgi:flagellar hook assembly protein FlgD